MEGRVSEYSGSRTSNTLLAGLKESRNPSVYIEKLEDLETVVQKAEIAVLFLVMNLMLVSKSTEESLLIIWNILSSTLL